MATVLCARALWTLRRLWDAAPAARFRGGLVAAFGAALIAALATYDPADPSWNSASDASPKNLLGGFGAAWADAGLQSLGLAAWIAALAMVVAGLHRAAARDPQSLRHHLRLKSAIAALGVLLLAGALAAPQPPVAWPLARGLGGFWGEGVLHGLTHLLRLVGLPAAHVVGASLLGLGAAAALVFAAGLKRRDFALAVEWLVWSGRVATGLTLMALRRSPPPEDTAEEEAVPLRRRRAKPEADEAPFETNAEVSERSSPSETGAPLAIKTPKAQPKPSGREARESQSAFDFAHPGGFRLPELAMLTKPKPRSAAIDEAALRQNARLLESVLAEFGVKGQIDQIRPGPVVTLYELVPAAGVKSSRVMSLADDIARSMSARACRVSVVQGRNAIGIELPNARRETVYLRDLLSSAEYEKAGWGLPMALGETIQGEPYVADLAKMPHLLIAGTTGSGKSVGVNAMILSILYRLPPDQCRFIMIDPKMLELSVYDGIPHLLAPVVTDPKKAIVALKWTVREMENRYRLMSKIGVRNVAGYNEKAREAAARGEHFERTVQTGFDDAGRPIYESEKLNPEPMPYLVVVIDEVADLMMVAGKDIEGAVQRLAQMARAAGIHLIMATQRPSVDVITGTIKANFPTRISFQVTSKIDARTILGEQGAEQLLGQGDMLYMAGGGRVTRLHGPFVSDGEVEAVAAYLRQQGEPQYLEEVTAAPDEDEAGEFGAGGEGGSGDDLYDQAVAVVTRDRKASTSYVQRRLQIGYNRAASLIERMEKEGVVSSANHAGKRDILAGPPPV
ncbi:MAG TPA: DNA translocase FtsK 4TM domain-containing protein [Caulobacteraceae bacterium]|jgi:S-DNA-T family DNA segregation ATPase FtsK/SpoIIIE|nr:DNA translocase FtsK 4TM domain-containing protein [Caulobacteraceae bacterium]